MAKHFTRVHAANGYAAMGNSLRRPRHKGSTSGSVASSIAQARAAAARAARIHSSKKK